MIGHTLSSALAFLGPVAVGAVLLFAGVAKALEPSNFVRHLKNLGLLPARWLPAAAVVAVALQCGLGAALMVALWPRWLTPAATLVLLALACLGYWGTATGRTEDCGCYNNLFTFSPLQSLLLDASYVALLGFSWWWGRPESAAPWRLGGALAAAAASGAWTYAALRYVARNDRPLLELSPLKPGRRWDPRWLGGGPDGVAEGERIVVFLGATCPHCKRWIKVLNVAHDLDGLPEVLGAVVLAESEVPAYVSESAIRFPVVAVKPWVLTRLARGSTPTTVLLQDGVIREKWSSSNMSKWFVERMQAASRRAGVSFAAESPGP